MRKLLYKLASLLYPYLVRLKKERVYHAEHITLAKTVSFSESADIRIVAGGSISIGDKTNLHEGVIVHSYGGIIEIGYNCSINPYTIIYGHGGTRIGNNVLIAGACMIIPSNHNYSDLNVPICDQGNTSKGIIIEDDVWLGHGCTVLDGVTIGKGAVIGAGSVVSTDVAPNSVYAGVPAKFIKHRGKGS